MHKALTCVERHSVLKVKELTVKLRELFRSTSSLLGASVYKALSQTLQINTKIRKPLTLTTRRLYCSKQGKCQMTINKAGLDKSNKIDSKKTTQRAADIKEGRYLVCCGIRTYLMKELVFTMSLKG